MKIVCVYFLRYVIIILNIITNDDWFSYLNLYIFVMQCKEMQKNAVNQNTTRMILT